MLDEDDLDAAAAEGIITAAQVEALRAFAGSRRQSAERADDERFRFMRGFNDFFLAVGIALLGLGIAYFADQDWIRNLVAAVIVWALAEFLVRRMRLVLPGILLVSLFAFFIFRAAALDWSKFAPTIVSPDGLPQLPARRIDPLLGHLEPIAIAGKALCAGLAAIVFYLRFRLPFGLLVIAGSFVLVASTLVGSIFFAGRMSPALVLLACGLAVFVAAMIYDLSDRMRTTRSADCAFWLHLLAAPLIVHSLIQLIVPTAVAGTLSMTTMSAIIIFAIVIVLTAIAVLIDRRALLVSALLYLGFAIAYALTGTVHARIDSKVVVFFATLVILGAMVLVLGVSWQPLRRLVLQSFPSGLAGRLPPATSSA